MFKFFTHENSSKPETVTDNTSEINKIEEVPAEIETTNTSELQTEESGEVGEVGQTEQEERAFLDSFELSYDMSPEYKEAFEAYVADPEAVQSALAEALESASNDVETNEDLSLFCVTEGNEDFEFPDPTSLILDTEGSVGEKLNESDESEQAKAPSSKVSRGNISVFTQRAISILSASAMLSVAACDKTTKNNVEINPSVALQVGKREKDKTDRMTGNPYGFTFHFGLGLQTRNEKLDLDGNTIKPQEKKPVVVEPLPVKETPQVPTHTPSVNKETPTPIIPSIPTSVHEVQKPKVVVESTTLNEVGPGGVVRKYLGGIFQKDPKDIDIAHDKMNLNDSTTEAWTIGGLRYYPKLEVCGLERMKNPSEQGVSVRAMTLRKLHSGITPRPLVAGMSFLDYTQPRGHLETFNNAKFVEDLKKSVPSEALGKGHHEEKMNNFVKENYIILKTLLEWAKLKSNPAHREELYNREVRPLEERSGSINH